MNEIGDGDTSPTTITRHYSAIGPAIAMLAGMQLDVFTPVEDGPANAEALAETLGFEASCRHYSMHWCWPIS